MTCNGSDADLLLAAARHLSADAASILRRYYGSSEDVRHELDELERTGRLQPSLVRLLQQELGMPAEPVE